MNRSKTVLASIGFLIIFVSFAISCKFHTPYRQVSVAALVGPASVSPNGDQVAVSSNDGNVQVWDITTEHIVSELKGIHTKSLNGIVWSPDGSKLVSLGSDDTAVIWDVGAKKSLQILEHERHFEGYIKDWHGWVDGALFSPDGRIVVTRWSGEYLYVWDMASGTLLNHHETTSLPIFSKDGSTLLFSLDKGYHSFDNVALLWDFGTNQEKSFVTKNQVDAAVFSVDENQILLIEQASSQSKLETWDVRTQTMIASFNLVKPPEAGTSLTYEFSNDRRRLLLNWSGSNQEVSIDKVASVWDLETRTEIAQLHDLSLYSKAHFLTPDGSLVISYTVAATQPFSHRLTLWNGSTGDFVVGLLAEKLSDKTQAPYLMIPLWTWSADGTRLTTADKYGVVQSWDLSQISP